MEWNLEGFEYDFKVMPPKAISAHWRCSHTEDGDYGTVYGEASVKDFEGELSTEPVMQFIWENGLDKTAAEKRVLDQISVAQAKRSMLEITRAFVSAPLEVQSDEVAMIEPKTSAVALIDEMLKATITRAELDAQSARDSIATAATQEDIQAVLANVPLVQIAAAQEAAAET